MINMVVFSHHLKNPPPMLQSHEYLQKEVIFSCDRDDSWYRLFSFTIPMALFIIPFGFNAFVLAVEQGSGPAPEVNTCYFFTQTQIPSSIFLW